VKFFEMICSNGMVKVDAVSGQAQQNLSVEFGCK